MKLNRISMLSIVLFAVLLLAGGFTGFTAVKAYASQTDPTGTETASPAADGSEEVDHTLVVIEGNEIPMAANVYESASSKEDLKRRQTTVIWVVALVFIVVCAIGYFAYFSGYRKRVVEIRRKIPKEERGPACAPTIVFQPNRWKDIADDYENELASKYIDKE